MNTLCHFFALDIFVNEKTFWIVSVEIIREFILIKKKMQFFGEIHRNNKFWFAWHLIFGIDFFSCVNQPIFYVTYYHMHLFKSNPKNKFTIYSGIFSTSWYYDVGSFVLKWKFFNSYILWLWCAALHADNHCQTDISD